VPAPFHKHVFRIASATVAGHCLGLVVLPILTRLYAPGDFGVLGIYTGVVSVVSATAMFRYEAGIATARSERRAAALLTVCTICLAAVCVCVLAVSALTGYPSSQLVAVPSGMLALGIMLSGTLQVGNYAAVRARSYGRLSLSKAVQGGAQVLGQLAGSAAGGSIGLVVGDLLGRLCGVATLASAFPWRRAFPFRPHVVWASARRYAYLPRTLGVAHLLGMASTQLPVILFPALFGTSVAGHYFMAYRLTYLPATLVAAAAAPVVLGELAAAHPERVTVYGVFHDALKRLVVLILPSYLIIMIAGPPMVGFCLGDAWLPSAEYVRWLAPAAAVWAVASPLSAVLVITDRGAEATIFSACDITLKLATLLVGAKWLGPQITIALLSTSSVGLTLVSLRRFNVAALHVGEFHSRLQLHRERAPLARVAQ
jgi:O-antigen/teichoic acid export membrane protein